MDVELVSELSFYLLALFSVQGLLDSFTGTCYGVLALVIRCYMPKSTRWMLGNSIKESTEP